MNIYVGKLALETTEDELREAFSAFGEVGTVRIVRDGTTGESRGFGFVDMPNEGEANTAIAELNGKELKGAAISVERGRGRPASGGFGGRRPRGGPGRPGGRGRPGGGGGRPSGPGGRGRGRSGPGRSRPSY
jgi:RNA recognition motif-containing protein